jgi:16S rRNA (adenine1518-N6/adenine1519-N6)-dimethyltransferase
VQTLADIKGLLADRGLTPRKALGQNFLIDKNLIARLVEASGVAAGDVVLEVGPGTGTLTEALLARGVEVVAGELDRGLAALLRERVAGLGLPGRFTLVEGDALASGRHVATGLVEALGGRAFRLVANLPYAAATPLMLSLLMEHPGCALQAVTIQREVAQRLLAKPGEKTYGTLSIVAQAVATVKSVATLPPECFWPRPEVTSAMVVVERRGVPRTRDAAALSRFAQRLFSARRKQLGSTLGRGLDWPKGIEATARPESLDPDQVEALRVVVERAGV